MSDETLSAILVHLPAEARRVGHALGLSHEETYACLVRLYDSGHVRISGDRSHTGQPMVWERA